MKIDIHPLTDRPNAAYEEISRSQKFIKLKTKIPTTPAAPNKARVVCMSDTHSLTPHLKFDIPDGDIFIHAGDFTKCGLQKEVQDFSKWLGNLPHKHKIVIAGNHELSFDKNFKHPFEKDEDLQENIENQCCGLGRSKTSCNVTQVPDVKDELRDCIYLEDSLVNIYGLQIYGAPWQPEFNGWAFNIPRGQPCLDKWNQIPDNVDILITHSPPLGHGDLACSSTRAGCVELLSTVQQRVRPKYHVFGHIHEGYGVSTDGKIIYVNASTCDINYIPNNQPIVFDVTLPSGHSKD